jgi:hypothetical protein
MKSQINLIIVHSSGDLLSTSVEMIPGNSSRAPSGWFFAIVAMAVGGGMF